MINFWKKHKQSNTIKDVNLLIKSILVYTKKFDETLENQYYFDQIKSNKVLQNICNFFKTILEDKHYINQSNKSSDKFKTLIKWTYESFYEKLTKK